MESGVLKRDTSCLEDDDAEVTGRTRNERKKKQRCSSGSKSAEKPAENSVRGKSPEVNGKEEKQVTNGDETENENKDETVNENKDETVTENKDETVNENKDEIETDLGDKEEQENGEDGSQQTDQDKTKKDSENVAPRRKIPYLDGTLNMQRIDYVPYIISLNLTKNLLPVSDGEDFLFPIVIELIETMFGSESVKPLKEVSLSSDVIRNCISDLATDVREKTIDALKASDYFSLLLDESTDSAYGTHLLVYARFLEEDQLQEEFLFSKTLATDPSGEDVFTAIYSFFRTHEISLASCMDVCIDSTGFLTGLEKDVMVFIKAVNPLVASSQCLIHRQKMASKDILSLLSTALTIGIRIINLIKTRPLDPDFREALWLNFQGEYEPLLLNSDTRWLSHGKSLGHLFEHRFEILRILNEMKNTNLASYVQDGVWLLSISYMADLFEKINEVNLTLKSKDSNILLMHDKIDALKKKMVIWGSRFMNGSTEMFPLLTRCIKVYPKEWNNVAKKLVCVHLPQVANYFNTTFRLKHHFDWIRNPFLADSEKQNDLSTFEKDELLELSSNRSLKLEFQHEKLETFWLKLKTSHPLLWKKALLSFLPFNSTQICDRGFSKFVSLLSKFDQEVYIENYMILGLTKRTPSFINLSPVSDD